MNIVRYKPKKTNLLGFDFNTLWDNFFNDNWLSLDSAYPKVDVKEEDKQYILEADLPGFTEKDIDVKVENDILTISSAKKQEKEEKKDGYLIRERRSSSVFRSFVLPNDVDRNKIKAAFTNGLLKLTLAKKEGTEARKIEVKAN